MAIEKGDLFHEPLRAGPVVAVQERKILTARQPDARVPCLGNALIYLIAHQTNLRVTIGSYDLLAPLGGAVVNTKQFEGGKGLGQYTIDRVTDVLLPIVDWNYHSHFGRLTHNKDLCACGL